MTTVPMSSGQTWELGEVIGKGGHGTVHLATSGGQEGVIKLVSEGPGSQRELVVGVDLHGIPNVVPILDLGRIGSQWALLMPRAELSLRQYLDRAKGPVGEADALPILLDIARALNALTNVSTSEGRGVVHRDLKPENVLYLNGTWCLSDFGIARYAAKDTETDTRRYLMTGHYAAPEQWTGETATMKADVYAFGVIAFELLMGERPFNGSSLREQHLQMPVPALPSVGPKLGTLVVECLQKLPGLRPTPTLLWNRLQPQAKSSPRTQGRLALQQANLAETVRQGQVAHSSVDAQSDEQRRRMLGAEADRQMQIISTEVRDAILSMAPLCVRVENCRPTDWILQLNQAKLGMMDSPAPFNHDHDSGKGGAGKAWGGRAWDMLRSRPPGLPFDVVAYWDIVVSQSSSDHVFKRYDTAEPIPYSGRAHSLWFCNAEDPDHYGWYEGGFVVEHAAHSDANNFDLLHLRKMEHRFTYEHSSKWHVPCYIEGRYIPLALSPLDRDAVSALRNAGVRKTLTPAAKPSHERTTLAQLAHSFTPVIPGQLDDFIDRWASWFAEASRGQLAPPR